MILAGGGCHSNQTALLSPSHTPFATNTEENTPIPSKTPTPAPTVIPTNTPAYQDAYLLELIRTNGNCDLPCIFGKIKIGMTADDFRKFFNDLGIEVGKGICELMSKDYCSFDLIPDFDDLSTGMRIHLYAYFENEVVKGLWFNLTLLEYVNELEQEDIEPFMLKTVLREFGIPSKVGIYIRFDNHDPTIAYVALVIEFDQNGIITLGLMKGNVTNDTVIFYPLRIEGYYSSISVFINIKMSYVYNDEFENISLEELIGMSPSAFYDLVINGDETTGFEVPAKIFKDLWIGGGE